MNSDKTLFNSDALTLLERLDNGRFTMAYVDPPWATSDGSDSKRQEYYLFISHVVQQCWRFLDDSLWKKISCSCRFSNRTAIGG